MKISRQDSNTSIIELHGCICKDILAVGKSLNAPASVFYMKTNDDWYRFFIDCGVLFWETYAPDKEDDLYDDVKYISILKAINEDNSVIRIEEIKMFEKCLLINLSNSHCIIINEDETTGEMTVKIQK